MLNHHLHAALHRNATILEPVQAFDHILPHKTFMIISQTVQVLSCSQRDTDTRRHY